ncbi:MAG: two-component sensor histidine kinase [Bacteroidetes bacterium HGW-Bacteroidetes-21]|jgi:signal transduction histidine kinase|nr:MAG: two-component sensor histidine kinase [Bacteroidetes bacterium HGW-Bacteroidetes-21]
MKIRNKITFRFTVLVFAVISLFSINIFFFSAQYRHEQFYSRLTDRAITTATLLIDVQEVDSVLLKIIDKNTIVLPNEKVEVYNSKGEKIYCSNENDFSCISKSLLLKIKREKEVRFDGGKIELLGLNYKTSAGEFIIVASAYDKYGKNKINHLRTILIIGLIVSALLTMVIGWFFSGSVMKPILRVISQVGKINDRNLNIRVDEGKGQDEISHLAYTFNKMLDRLQKAFDIQKSFVSSASHELRTPLTSITGQIQVTLLKERTKDEYSKILQSIDEDIKHLNQLTNGLLELTYLSMDAQTIRFEKIRIDELLWSVRSEYLTQKPGNEVLLDFNIFPDHESKLMILGNDYLLKIAIKNLIDNGCKFSDNHSIRIKFNYTENSIILHFNNNGIPIPEKDMENIFLSFFRSSNSATISGHGLGLSLVKRIIEMHNGTIHVTSNSEEGTSFSVTLPIANN